MSKITFVCCIEAGALESLTLRMIYSLRQWGGQYKNAAIIAVQPRLGAPLSKETRRLLKLNAVKYISSNVNTEAWFKYMNKPHALRIANEHVMTEYVCWIDSDIILLKEPFSSVLPIKNDVYACASDKNIGTSGENDKFDPYWAQLCQTLKLDIKKLPWIVTKHGQEKIRLYFNSGVFLYKKNTGFSKKYLTICQSLLLSKISNSESGIFFTDQVALGLTISSMNLSYGELPLAEVAEKHDFSGDISILHYHDMMWPNNWDNLLSIINDKNIDAREWLIKVGPMSNDSNIFYKVISLFLSNLRELRVKLFLKSCKVVC